MPESASKIDVPPPAWWRLGPGLWIASAVALVMAYLAFNLPGNWFGTGMPQRYPGAAMSIGAGFGQVQGDKLIITSPDPKNAVVLALNTPGIPTQQYGLITLDVDGMPDDAEAILFWRNDFAPSKLFTRSLAVAGGRLQSAMLAADSNWLGRIQSIGLIVNGALPQPLIVSGIAIKPASAASVLAERWREWFHRETWSGISLSRVVGGRAGMDLPLPLLTGLAAALGCCVYLAIRRWRRWASPALPIAALLMSGWLVLDMRWQWNLGWDAIASWNDFAGKDLSSKRLAGVDAELETIAADVRPLLTPNARLFVFAQDPVSAGRLAYLLLPEKVYYDTARAALPAPGRLKAGDLVLVHRKAGVRYSPDRKEFLWDDRSRVPAELLYVKRGTVLARIL